MSTAAQIEKLFAAANRQGFEPAVVLLRDKRAFQKEWPRRRPTIEQAIKHLKKSPSRNGIGIQPASIGCVVLDCDEGDGPEAAAKIVRDEMGDVVAAVTPSSSGRKDRGHVWVRCDEPLSVKNWKFRLEDPIEEAVAWGDMRSSGGQVRLTDGAIPILTDMLEGSDGLDDRASIANFQQIRTSKATDFENNFDRRSGSDEVSDDTIAALGSTLEGPEGGPRFEHLFALVCVIKRSGASFNAALDFLSGFVPNWADENGEDDGKFAGNKLERHLSLAWAKAPVYVSAENDFDDIEDECDAATSSSNSCNEVSKSGNPQDTIVEEMNETFCGVLHGGQFQVFMEDTDDAFFDRKVWTSLSREAFRNYLQDEKVPLPDTPKHRFPSKADHWLNHPKRRKYRGIVMDPQRLPHNRDKLNLWRGWAVAPKPGDWSLMEELIADVLCNGDSSSENYVRRWIAYMLQKPWETPEAAIAFRGSEGTGKGTLGRALMKIAGPHGLTVSSRAQFAGRFNSHLRNCVFLFADEAVWPGDKEGEGIIKQLVTEPIISYEAKGRDITPGRNMVHMMLASNEDWIVPAGKDARRFFVTDVSERRRNDQDFFGRLNRQMEDGGLEAMMHELIRLDLDGWRPATNIPQTKALGDQKVQSLDPPFKFWLSVLSEGTLVDIISTEGDAEDWSSGPIEIGPRGKELVVAAYDHYLKRNRILSVRPTSKALVKAAKEFGLETTRSSGGRQRLWVVPPISEMRARFERAIGAFDIFDD